MPSSTLSPVRLSVRTVQPVVHCSRDRARLDIAVERPEYGNLETSRMQVAYNTPTGSRVPLSGKFGTSRTLCQEN